MMKTRSHILDRTLKACGRLFGCCLCLAAGIASGADRGAYNNVAEATNYSLVYLLNIPNSPNYANGVTYDIDLRKYVSDFDRIAYYLEVQAGFGPFVYVWVSMDAFTHGVDQIGVPTVGSGAVFQQPITNMNVVSSASWVTNGTNLAGGNIEFWPYNYDPVNSAGVANASDTLFDWGDHPQGVGNYGSMQVHNAAARQVVFAFNRWGGYPGMADLGIGNGPAGTNPDWTFDQNAASYSTFKTLLVYVRQPRDTNPPVLLKAAGFVGLTNAVLTLSKVVDESATNPANYSLDGGVSVVSAVMDPLTELRVLLTTTPQQPLTPYVVTVNGVKDRTPNHLQIAANSTATFRSSVAGLDGTNSVPEAALYKLVYALSIPSQANYTNGVTYDSDLRADVSGFSRIAYYMLLQQSGGSVNYLWVSMDAFTSDVNKIGVPTVSSGAVFQQPVTHMSVFSSDTNIVTGTNLTGGHLEFWPSSYDPFNSAGVTNASSSVYDWGDHPIPGAYGSMQVNNAGASQVLFAFNNWAGNGGMVDLGIGNDPVGANPDWTFARNGDGYSLKILEVFVLPIIDTNSPTMLSAVGAANLTNVTVAFSKPLDDGATNTADYALTGGLTVLGAALDSLDKTTVTLTTSPQKPFTAYTLKVNGVKDRNGSHTPIAPDSTITFTSSPVRGYLNNVPEAADYALVYWLNIPNSPDYASGIYYDTDLHRYITDYSRIAYYLELQTPDGGLNFVWVSMDAFAPGAESIGVPTVSSGAVFQQPVTNMNVLCSVAGVVNGTGLGGNLEFWPYDYEPSNTAGVPNASDTAFDWGDHHLGTGTYGSMQVHNPAASQVLFAFNRWGGYPGTADLGIGNGPPGTSPDWTFDQNASGYTVKTLQVLVLPASHTNPPVLIGAVGQFGLTNVVLNFSKALDESATNIANYALDGGLSVLGAVLDPLTKVAVTLVTTPQSPATSYTVTVNGVRDRTAEHLPIASNATATFRSSVASRGVDRNVAEAADYVLVYWLEIPDVANYANSITYNLDPHRQVGRFSRVAYYLELEPKGGPLNYLWVSMDAFTPNVNQIGVPTASSGAFFQQPVANMTVLSSDPAIVAGTNLAGGNLEFWPTDYEPVNSAAVPFASDGVYDWGDHPIPGNYGSMQAHNSAARQVLFAFNDWGGSGLVGDLGIGNNPTGLNPDWTSEANASRYSVKTLQVFVKLIPTLPPIGGQFTAAGQFLLTWQASPGTSYSILRKPVLDESAWTKVGAVTATTNSAEFLDPQATNGASYYQISTP